MRRIAVVVIGMLLAGAAGPAGAGVGNLVTLKAACTEFALNPVTGDLLALDTEGNTATLYPAGFLDGQAAAKPVGPVKLPGRPRQAHFKPYRDASLFLLTFESIPAVMVLDAATLKTVATIPLQAHRVTSLAASPDKDDPAVFYTAFRSTGSSHRVGRLDLAKMAADDGQAPDAYAMSVAISASGDYLYCQSAGDSGSVELWGRPGGAAGARWERLRTVQIEEPLVAGPIGDYYIAQTTVYSLDLQPQTLRAPFAPRCGFMTAPVVVGILGTELMFLSTNDFTVSDKLAIPAVFLDREESPRPGEPKPPRGPSGPVARASDPAPLLPCDYWPAQSVRPRQRRSMNARLRLLADDVHRRLLLADGDHVFLVPLAKLDAGSLPSLTVRFRPPLNASVGEPLRVPLAAAPDCKLALRAAPPGAVLKDNVLEWTPADSQVGPQRVTLEAASGKAAKTYVFSVNVTRRFLQLSFSPRAVEMRSDGKAALAWRVGTSGSGSARSSSLALLDLAQPRVVATRELPVGLTGVALDAHFVYLVRDGADRIECLSAKDLSDQTFVFTASRPRKLYPLADKWLYVSTSSGPAVWSVPDMKPSPLPFSWPLADQAPPGQGASGVPRPSGSRRSVRYLRVDGNMQVPEAQRFSDGWFVQGRLFDRNLSALRGIVHPMGLPMGVLQVQWPRVSPSSSSEAPFVLTAWNRRIAGEAVADAAHHVVGSLPGRLAILPDLPLAVRLSTKQENETFSVSLALHELISLDTLQTVPLIQQVPAREWYRRYSHSEGPVDPLAVAASTVVATLGSTVFIHPVQTPPGLADRQPLALRYPKSLPWISMAEKSTLTHEAVGGTKPFTFSLVSTSAGVAINAETGALTIDGPALNGEPVAAALLAAAHAARDDDSVYRETDAGKLLAAALADFAPRASEALGRKPVGITLLLPVRVQVADAKGQEATIHYHVVVEAPPSVLAVHAEASAAKAREAKAQSDAEIARQAQFRKDEEARRAERERRAAAPPAPAPAPDRVVQLEQKVTQLEKRLQTLETQLDLLTRLLGDRVEPKKPAAPK